MHRIGFIFTLLALSLIASNGYSAPISLSGLSGNYTAGEAISFEVTLPPIEDLGSYNIDLLLTGTSGIAGTDFFFDVATTEASSTGYVFPSTANYFDAVNMDSPMVHRLTLSDFNFTGVDVVADVNHSVATVVIGTASGFDGDMLLSIDTTGLILDTPDASPTSVLGFTQIVTDTQAEGGIEIVAVPEPNALVLVLGLSLTVCTSKRGVLC